MINCLIISFDFIKKEYPNVPYSIASLLAYFSNRRDISFTHNSFNLRKYIDRKKIDIEQSIILEFEFMFLKNINEYNYICLSLYS
jgi:hypothetical protein